KMSIEAWVYPITYTGYHEAILSKPGNYTFYLMPDGRLGCYLYGPKPQDYYVSDSIVPINQWSHIAPTYDGEKLKFYINGKPDREIPLSGQFKPCLDRIHNIEYQKFPLYFGVEDIPRVSNAIPHFWHGQLDEVRILNRVLSEGEIKCDYERRKYCPIEPSILLGQEEQE
ncbi:MAG: LamG domain-containing protein, partial [Planctomycetota bacterium]